MKYQTTQKDIFEVGKLPHIINTNTSISALIQSHFKNYKMGHVSKLSQKETPQELYLKPTVKKYKSVKRTYIYIYTIITYCIACSFENGKVC